MLWLTMAVYYHTVVSLSSEVYSAQTGSLYIAPRLQKLKQFTFTPALKREPSSPSPSTIHLSLRMWCYFSLSHSGLCNTALGGQLECMGIVLRWEWGSFTPGWWWRPQKHLALHTRLLGLTAHHRSGMIHQNAPPQYHFTSQLTISVIFLIL